MKDFSQRCEHQIGAANCYTFLVFLAKRPRAPLASTRPYMILLLLIKGLPPLPKVCIIYFCPIPQLFRGAASQYLALPVCLSFQLALFTLETSTWATMAPGWRQEFRNKCTHVYYMCTSVLVYKYRTAPSKECALRVSTAPLLRPVSYWLSYNIAN